MAVGSKRQFQIFREAEDNTELEVWRCIRGGKSVILVTNIGGSQIDQGSLRLECRSDKVLINSVGSSRAKTVGDRSPNLGRNSQPLGLHWTQSLAGGYSVRP